MKRRKGKKRIRRQRAGGMKHLKAAIRKRASDSAHRIGKYIINRKLGETFLIPSLRPNYSSTSDLIKEELNRTVKEVRKHPWKTLKSAYHLLRAK